MRINLKTKFFFLIFLAAFGCHSLRAVWLENLVLGAWHLYTIYRDSRHAEVAKSIDKKYGIRNYSSTVCRDSRVAKSVDKKYGLKACCLGLRLVTQPEETPKYATAPVRTAGNFVCDTVEKKIRQQWDEFKISHARDLQQLGGILNNNYDGPLEVYLDYDRRSREFERTQPELYKAWKEFFEKKRAEIERNGYTFNYGTKVRLVPDQSMSFIVSESTLVSLATGEVFFGIDGEYGLPQDTNAFHSWTAKHEWGHAYDFMRNFVVFLKKSISSCRLGLNYVTYLHWQDCDELLAASYKKVTEMELFAEAFAIRNATNQELRALKGVWEQELQDLEESFSNYLPKNPSEQDKEALRWDFSMAQYNNEAVKNNVADDHPHAASVYRLIMEELEKRQGLHEEFI